MNAYEVLPVRRQATSRASNLVSANAPAREEQGRRGISTATVVVIAAAICIVLLALVNLAYSGDTSVLQGVDTLAKVG